MTKLLVHTQSLVFAGGRSRIIATDPVTFTEVVACLPEQTYDVVGTDRYQLDPAHELTLRSTKEHHA